MYKLRYRVHDIELPQGDFVIGRTADCHLALDDDQVSRRHALVSVAPDGVIVRDLGSRNGVKVNGSPIAGAHRLADGDRITIGSQTLHVLAVEETRAASGGRGEVPTQLGPTATPAPVSGTALLAGPPSSRGRSVAMAVELASKLLTTGRAADAERVLQRPIADLLEAVHRGDALEPDATRLAAEIAVRMATATGRGAWIDLLIEVHLILGALLPPHVCDSLYDVVRKVRIDVPMLRAYVRRLRQEAPILGPAARFQLQRIEGLERIARP